MNREQPAKQADFQAVMMGSTPIRFTKSCRRGGIGRHVGSRSPCLGVRVQVLSAAPINAPVVQSAETMRLERMRCGFEFHLEHQFSGVGEGSFATVS